MQVRHMPNEHGHNSHRTLFNLPAELIEEIYLLALSPVFPQVCKHIHSTVKSFSPFAHANYILGRHPLQTYYPFPSEDESEATFEVSSFLSSALRYPITTLAVLKALYDIITRSSLIFEDFEREHLIELPKRLFRSLDEPDVTRDVNSDPLPILRFLWGSVDFPRPIACSHGGYPLVQAVHAGFIPLVDFLLDYGADFGQQEYSAVKVAMDKKDLKLLNILLKFGKTTRQGWSGVVRHLLEVAIECDARDIAKYLMEEQGADPGGRAVYVAIRKKNLELVKMLLEFEGMLELREKHTWESWSKRFLAMAVKQDTQDIVKYLVEEHGCILQS